MVKPIVAKVRDMQISVGDRDIQICFSEGEKNQQRLNKKGWMFISKDAREKRCIGNTEELHNYYLRFSGGISDFEMNGAFLDSFFFPQTMECVFSARNPEDLLDELNDTAPTNFHGSITCTRE